MPAYGRGTGSEEAGDVLTFLWVYPGKWGISSREELLFEGGAPRFF